jgi:hypothetical protein
MAEVLQRCLACLYSTFSCIHTGEVTANKVGLEERVLGDPESRIIPEGKRIFTARDEGSRAPGLNNGDFLYIKG